MKFVQIMSCVLLLYATSNLAVADITNYGSLSGDTVTFGDVQEDSITSDGAVYGEPTAAGDNLSFTPFGFSGFSDGGLDFQEGRLSMDITAGEGFLIQSIEIAEASSFFFFGDEAMVMSNTLGVANSNGNIYTASSSNEMTGETFTGGNSFETLLRIELPDVGHARFVVDAQIFAAALGDADLASISKDALVVRVTTIPVSSVPEPASAGLMVALALSCVMKRRR